MCQEMKSTKCESNNWKPNKKKKEKEVLEAMGGKLPPPPLCAESLSVWLLQDLGTIIQIVSVDQICSMTFSRVL